MQVVKELNYVPPQDLSVVGYDDVEVADILAASRGETTNRIEIAIQEVNP
jgi:DNA-binding LacI/PurR family transcriptional regulator